MNKTFAALIALLFFGSSLVMITSSARAQVKQRTQQQKPPAEAATRSKPIARWDLQQSGVEDDLIDVCFVNADIGWAVGKSNTVLRTRDGGRTWTRAMERDEHGYQFTQVIFSSPTEGWIRAAGTVLHTGDGGETWTPATHLKKELDMGFGDGSVVGSVRFQIHVPNTGTGVYRTDDGGASWVRLVSLPRNDYQRVFFVDEQHGWVIANHGDQSIGFTTDGGKTWDFVTEQVSYRDPQIKFATPAIGWAFGQDGSTLLASVDGGHTWKRQYTGIPGYHPLEGMVFVNEREGFICAEDKVIHTINGGNSWQSVGSFPPSTLSALSFPDNSHGWVVGRKGYISHYHVVTGGPEGPR